MSTCPVFLNGLQCQVSKLANSDTRTRPTAQEPRSRKVCLRHPVRPRPLLRGRRHLHVRRPAGAAELHHHAGAPLGEVAVVQSRLALLSCTRRVPLGTGPGSADRHCGHRLRCVWSSLNLVSGAWIENANLLWEGGAEDSKRTVGGVGPLRDRANLRRAPAGPEMNS
jgi:hypothetical protein